MVYRRKDRDERERRELASVVYIPSVPSGGICLEESYDWR